MAHLPSLLPLFFFLQILLGVHVSISHGLPLPPVYNPSMCGGVSSISYRFHHSNETDYVDSTSYYCGYTDLNITCIQDGVNHKATIQLLGHEYPIKEIVIYDNETVGLADSDVLRGGKCPKSATTSASTRRFIHSVSRLKREEVANYAFRDVHGWAVDAERLWSMVSSWSMAVEYLQRPTNVNARWKMTLRREMANPISCRLNELGSIESVKWITVGHM
ncbi:hypothetical protein ABZP36_015244 [Zizania latifolia]